MKMNAPTAPPAHRLPVLTEVVRLDDEPPIAADGSSLVPAAWAEMPVLIDVADLPEEPLVTAAPVAPVPSPTDVLRAAFAAPLQAPVAMPAAGPSFLPSDAASQALAVSAHEAAAVAANAFEESGGLPGSDLPQPPAWLRRRPAETPAPALPLPAAAPQAPLPADFSGSWWSRDDGHVPDDVKPLAPAPAPEPPAARLAPAINEVALVRRVMQDLDGQIDLMFDHRMREVIAPALARAADALMADLRERLAVAVRDMVVKAVAVEVSRVQRDGDGG